jgi:MFS transporter, DHA1 family, multidrug resistance protein
MMGMMIAISPGLAPIIGGFIGLYFNWRATFGFLVIASVALLFTAFYLLPETLAQNSRQIKSSQSIFKDYIALFKCRPFILNGLILGLTIAQLWVEMGNLPFLFIQTLNVPSHHYGIYFGSGVFIFVLGTLFNQRYVMTYGVKRLLLAGILLKILSIALLCSAAFLNVNQAWLIQLLIYPGAFGLALVIGNASSQSLSAIHENVGTASAIIYLLEMALAGSVLFIAGLFYNDTLWPIAIAGVIWMVLIFGIYRIKHE